MTPTPPLADEKAGTRTECLKAVAALPATAHLTTQEAAAYLGTSAAVLRVWRSQDKGPRFRGRGHFIRYVKADLDDFMDGFGRLNSLYDAGGDSDQSE